MVGTPGPNIDTVAALIVAWQGGDGRALARLVELLQPVLLPMAARIVRDPIAAEDVFIETMAKLAQGFREMADPQAGFAYARRTLRNRAVDHLRSRSARDARRALEDTDRLQANLPEGVDAAVDRIPDGRFDPEAALLDREAGVRVAAAVDALDPRQRDAVDRFYRRDQSYAEIAAAGGVSEATVKRDLAAARRSVAAALIDQEVSGVD